MGGSLLSDRAVPLKGLSHEMDLSFEENGKIVFLADSASFVGLIMLAACTK